MRTATPPDVPGLISGGQARRRRRNAVWAGASVLAVVIAAGGVYGVTQLGDDADSTSQITHQPTPQPLPDNGAPVAAGTYAVPADNTSVVTGYTLTVPAGWIGSGVSVSKNEDETGHQETDALSLDSFALDQIQLTTDTCTGDETLGKAQTSTAGLVAALRSQGHGLRVSNPVTTTVGGLPATRVDLAYPGSKPLANCRLSDEPGVVRGVLQVWSGYFVLFPGEIASAYVVDVDGRAQVFTTRIQGGASAADRAELQSILDSISFQTGGQ